MKTKYFFSVFIFLTCCGQINENLYYAHSNFTSDHSDFTLPDHVMDRSLTIYAKLPTSSSGKVTSLCNGIYLGEGYVLTNAHCLYGADLFGLPPDQFPDMIHQDDLHVKLNFRDVTYNFNTVKIVNHEYSWDGHQKIDYAILWIRAKHVFKEANLKLSTESLTDASIPLSAYIYAIRDNMPEKINMLASNNLEQKLTGLLLPREYCYIGSLNGASGAGVYNSAGNHLLGIHATTLDSKGIYYGLYTPLPYIYENNKLVFQKIIDGSRDVF